jgi:hypothetical protein
VTVFYVGCKVITRREKIGTVVAVDDDAFTVDVKFGGKVFTMRQGQVKGLDAHRKQMTGTRRQQDELR